MPNLTSRLRYVGVAQANRSPEEKNTITNSIRPAYSLHTFDKVIPLVADKYTELR